MVRSMRLTSRWWAVLVISVLHLLKQAFSLRQALDSGQKASTRRKLKGGASEAASSTDGKACRSRFRKWSELRVICVNDLAQYEAAGGSSAGPEDEVLEVGCQMGATTAALCRHASRVIGIDIMRKTELASTEKANKAILPQS